MKVNTSALEEAGDGYTTEPVYPQLTATASFEKAVTSY